MCIEETDLEIDRDGTLDIVFPTCSRQSVASGIGSDCSINIAYNKQVPVCSGEEATHGADGALICRGWGELCGADESFDFDFTAGSEVSLPTIIGRRCAFRHDAKSP